MFVYVAKIIDIEDAAVPCANRSKAFLYDV
jgi:hypothetical protein